MLRTPSLVLSVVAATYGLSAMGDQMAMVALTLRLHDQGESGAVISVLVIASVVPIVVIGPLIGPLIDRVESGRLIVVVTAFQAVVAAALAVVDNTAATIALLALLGAGLAIVSPALQLVVPEIMGEDETARGYARLDTFKSLGSVAGPALAGVLVAAFDDRIALLCDAGSFAVMALVFASLKVRREPVSLPTSRPRWAAQVREGVGVLGQDRLLRTAILSLASAIVFTAMLNVARVFFIRDDLNASDADYGVLVTAHTVGTLVAAALVAPRVPLSWQPRVLAGSGALMGAGLILGASVPIFAIVLIAFILTGMANALQSLAIRNLIHGRVNTEVRGRAFASSSAALNGANLTGTALGGPAAAQLGGDGALQLAGAGTLLASLAAAPVLFQRSEQQCRVGENSSPEVEVAKDS
ncbi:MFS transporter [Streptomyces sp. MB09-01]|uniref:MFS transporter n=1 Tax=unclassified Streptomyces TaxID=2593676 RepID=UPI0029B92167|nr:MFS transporter [Streptomyces sp. MB09-01]MDX3538674.1 MFS transporter [Streptomyces sp. MB09-01]